MSSTITKILYITLISLSNYVLAEDFSIGGNSNPYAKYVYKNPLEINYIDNRITSPIEAIKQTQTDSNNSLLSFNDLNNNSRVQHTCWDSAAKLYKIDPWLLFSYAYVESRFNSQVTNVNSNKTVDIGLMQINSSWLKTLNKYGFTVKHLFDPCTSIFIGAWIAKQNLNHFGYNIDGIGAYNSPGNITKRRIYGKKVIEAYAMLTKKYRKS